MKKEVEKTLKEGKAATAEEGATLAASKLSVEERELAVEKAEIE